MLPIVENTVVVKNLRIGDKIFPEVSHCWRDLLHCTSLNHSTNDVASSILQQNLIFYPRGSIARYRWIDDSLLNDNLIRSYRLMLIVPTTNSRWLVCIPKHFGRHLVGYDTMMTCNRCLSMGGNSEQHNCLIYCFLNWLIFFSLLLLLTPIRNERSIAANSACSTFNMQ